MPISESNKTDLLDRSENVICNGLATNETLNYKARIDEKNRLHVCALSPFIGRCLIDVNTVALQTTYQDFLNLTQCGELQGFKFKVSNGSATVRLEIDGQECFALNFDQLRSCNFASYNDAGLNRFFGTEQYGEIEFFPNIPWAFKTSLKIQIKKDVTWSIDRQKGVVLYAI